MLTVPFDEFCVLVFPHIRNEWKRWREGDCFTADVS